VMADHDDGWRRRRVVVCGEDAAAEGADAERREVVAGDVFRPERARGDVHARPADADAVAAGLEGGQLLELWRFRFERSKSGYENMPQRSCGPPWTQQLSPSPTR